MSGNDFLGAFYEKPQKPYGFSWLEGVQTGQEFENPAASATTPSPDENSFHSFYCTKGAYITLNHAGKRAFRNPLARPTPPSSRSSKDFRKTPETSAAKASTISLQSTAAQEN